MIEMLALSNFPELLGDPDVMAIALLSRIYDDKRITKEEYWAITETPLSWVRRKTGTVLP